MTDRTVSVALQLKIAGYTNGLRQARKATKDFGDDLGKQARANKGSFDSVGRAAGGIGLVAGAGLAVAVRSFANFDKAMSNVKAATHESAGNMEQLRTAAIKAGKDTAFSATEAAQGIENLAKAGVSTKDILGGGLKGALDLAAAGELGVGDAAETAATAMTQFKLKGSDVPHIADLLAAAAGKAQGEVSDMAMGLKQGGLVAAQMGLSIEETTGSLAAFASAGLIGSDAGTSLKTMLLALANPSVKAAGTMKELGLHVYDANGAFMGMAPLAEQLKTKLGNLSEEQRNSALATIFGSDAIRAASVLYSNGAAGIADWTTKVNDQGFAAETAAIKTDNLKGDIERLGGSIDTALIQQGSGANDALRAMAKGAGLLVDGIGNLPDSVSKVGLALGAVATFGGLGAAGLLKAASAASQAKEAWEGLGTVGRRLTLSMGAVGIALTAAVAVYGAFSKRNAEAKQKADDLRATLDEQTGAITGNTRAYVSNNLAQSGMADKAKALGLSLADVTSAALGNAPALRNVTDQLDAMIEAGKTNGAVTTKAQYDLTQQGIAAGFLKDELLGTNKSLTEAQRVQKLAAEGATEHKDAQTLEAEAVKKANEQVQQEAESLDDLIKKMHAASGEALSLSAAQISYQEALTAATEAEDKNANSIDKKTGKIRLDTEAGRAQQKALNALAEATNDQTDAMLKHGESNDKVRKTSEAARKKFIEVAVQMGVNKKEAERLSKEYIDIPDSVDTKVTNNAAAKPSADVKHYQELLEHNPNEKTTKIKTAGIPFAWGQILTFSKNVDKTLSAIADETITVTARLNSANIGGKNDRDRRLQGAGMADGGGVFGGERGKDSVPALLMPDEHVWTTKETAAVGGHGAMKRLRQAALAGELNGYAKGGGIAIRMRTPGNAEIARMAASASAAALEAVRPAAQAAADKAFAVGVNPGGVSNFRGKRLNARTIDMLLNAERLLGARFHITQGSYNTSVAASGSTHAGGGAMDTDGPRGWNTAVSALRRAGFAAWHRTPSQGPWGHHIHSIAIGDASASQAAKNQVRSYLAGGNGLGGAGNKNAIDRRLQGVGMAAGGKPVLVRDLGGKLPTGPSFVFNGTGSPETVRNASQEAALHGPTDLSDKTLQAMRKMFTAAITDGKFRLVNSGGVQVLVASNG